MTAVAVVLLLALVAGWVTMDHGDDGITVPLQRLAERRGTAARIDVGVALAERDR
jgi:hypothetical protein